MSYKHFKQLLLNSFISFAFITSVLPLRFFFGTFYVTEWLGYTLTCVGPLFHPVPLVHYVPFSVMLPVSITHVPMSSRSQRSKYVICQKKTFISIFTDFLTAFYFDILF